jgi:S-DNA-T family DNA segregation ATPase FtsK/SpoIIIE
MFEQRNLKLDLLALGLVALVLLIGLSLVTYDPADSVGTMVWPFNAVYQQDAVVYPPSEKITNVCGCLGALVSDVLLTGLGIGAYYLLFSAVVLNVVLLMRREITTPLIRFFGWFGSLAGGTTLTAVLLPAMSPGPVIGPGGYLGALGRGILESHFALVGSVILAVSVMLGGLMLCTDYTIFEIAAFISRNTLGRIALRRRKLEAEAEGEEEWYEEGEEEELEEEDEDESQTLKIRVSGRKLKEEESLEDEAEEEEEDEEEEDEEEDLDEEEEAAEDEEKTSMLAAVKKRLKPKLRVKKPKTKKRLRCWRR